MQGYFFIEVQDNKIAARGRILENVGNGNYAVQVFDQDGKPNPMIPVRILSSSSFGAFNLFPTLEHANVWLEAVTKQGEEEPAPKRSTRKRGRPQKASPTPANEG